jgi:excisionase family DNA binding protein
MWKNITKKFGKKEKIFKTEEYIIMETELVSIGEAAKMLGVTCRTLRNWEKAGKIAPARTLGKHRRYKLVDIKALLGEVSATPKKDLMGMLQKIHDAINEYD